MSDWHENGLCQKNDLHSHGLEGRIRGRGSGQEAAEPDQAAGKRAQFSRSSSILSVESLRARWPF